MRTYDKGRSTEGWEKGAPVRDAFHIKPGTVIIGVSHQFKAENLYKVVPKPKDYQDMGPGEGFYVKYVETDGVTPHRYDGERLQWVWAAELDDSLTWFIADKLPCTLPVVKEPVKLTLTDAAPALIEGGGRQVEVKFENLADGSIALMIPGYGTSDMQDGYGSPIILELWEGRLRLCVWNDINAEDPTIIDLEGARENTRTPEGLETL